MNGTEIPAAYSLRKEGMRHGLTLSLMGLGLFVALGATGLLLHLFADPGTEHGPESRGAGLGGWGVDGRQAEVLAWTTPSPLPEWTGGSSDYLDPRATVSAAGTPLVFVAEGLAEFEASRDGERSLLLETDGTIRTEPAGTLVGFLQGGGLPETGDFLSGSGQIEFRLLHQDSWLADRVRVPVVEPDGAGGWVVRGHRTFGIGITRELKRTHQDGRGRPMLHPRTGLPQVELVLRRD